jgi:hypothetical protein
VVIFSGWTTGVLKSSRCDFTAYTTNVAVPEPETGGRPLANGKFSGLDRDTILAFLRDLPTPRQAGTAALARMAAFCARHGSSGRTSPEILTGQLRAPLLSAGEGTVTGKAFTVLLFAELLNGQLRALNTRITSLVAVHLMRRPPACRGPRHGFPDDHRRAGYLHISVRRRSPQLRFERFRPAFS